MLFELYSTLCKNTPKEGCGLLGLPIDKEPSAWLSIDQNTFPSLLLPAQPNDIRPDIVLRSINVAFSRPCDISLPDGKQHSGCYTIIIVKEADPDIVRLFSKILEERFCRSSELRNNAEIATNVQELAALFSKIDGSSKDLIGLWGELNLILQSQDLLTAVKSWSSSKTAKYDFVARGFVLEVKSTLSVTPKYRFSMEQLRPNGDFAAYVVSCCLSETQSGKTVGELTDTIEAKIEDPETRTAFLKQCFEKGGKDIYRSKMRLQTYPDGGALSFYDARSIPVPLVELSQPISNIRFDVDLTSVPELARSESSRVLRFGG